MTTDEISDYLMAALRRRIDGGEQSSDLAKRLKVKPQRLSNWLGARASIPASEHASIAARLGLELVVRPAQSERLSAAMARLSRSQLDDLTSLAERIASGSVDPTMLTVAAKLLGLRAHDLGATEAHK